MSEEEEEEEVGLSSNGLLGSLPADDELDVFDLDLDM